MVRRGRRVTRSVAEGTVGVFVLARAHGDCEGWGVSENRAEPPGIVPTLKIEISTGEGSRILALTTAAFLVLRVVWVAHPVFFVLFLGILFSLPLSSAADRMEKRGMRRGVSVSIILVVFCGLLTAGGIFMAPILRS